MRVTALCYNFFILSIPLQNRLSAQQVSRLADAGKLARKPDLTATIIRYTIANAPDLRSMNTQEQESDNVFFFNQKAHGSSKTIYTGKSVFLMNEITQSMAEHSGMYLKSIASTIFIGSRTAGADGVLNFSNNIHFLFTLCLIIMGYHLPVHQIKYSSFLAVKEFLINLIVKGFSYSALLKLLMYCSISFKQPIT